MSPDNVNMKLGVGVGVGVNSCDINILKYKRLKVTFYLLKKSTMSPNTPIPKK